MIGLMGISIKCITEEFDRAIRRAQVGMWKLIMQAYEAGNVSNEALDEMLLRDDEFAVWFWNKEWEGN